MSGQRDVQLWAAGTRIEWVRVGGEVDGTLDGRCRSPDRELPGAMPDESQAHCGHCESRFIEAMVLPGGAANVNIAGGALIVQAGASPKPPNSTLLA